MGTFIIGEAGVNHNGSPELAKRLVDVAAEAGCDAVKFQTFKAENLVTRSARKAQYQVENTGSSESQFDMLKKLELDYENHIELIDYCRSKNIMFLSTPFDEESADMLDTLGVGIYKIPSGEITNKPFLQHIARKGKPIILSTGMATMEEVGEALSWVHDEGNHDVILLHCTSNYPTVPGDVNLRAMLTLKEKFGVRVGYSDHTVGIEIPIAAAALGTEIIEKHFTLDKSMEGPDHKASLEPDELKAMVKAIRNIEDALGDGIKKPVAAEMDTRAIARKSITAARDISKGEVFTRDMLVIKRPGTGLEPKMLDEVIGRTALREIKGEQLISIEDFK